MTKQEVVVIRCAPNEKAAWRKAAGSPRAFSSWARAQLNQATGLELAERDTESGGNGKEAASTPGDESVPRAVPRSASSKKPVLCPHRVDLNTQYCPKCG